jgi:hypothetical protein
MVDRLLYRFKLSVAAFLGLTWVLAILIPILLGRPAAVADAGSAGVWWVLGGIFAYFLYTGVSAWRRGWRGRFVLRVVVPIALLIVSSILEWLGVWRLLLKS